MLSSVRTPSEQSDAQTSHLPLKICLLGYRNNPYSGGQGIYIRYLSRVLVEAGHQVDVISGQPYPELDPRVRLVKLPSLNLFEANNHVTALRPKHLLSYTDFFEWFSMLTGGFSEPYTFGRRLVKYFKTHQIDYDIIHDNQSLCYGLLQLKKMGLPIVATIHHPITSDRDIALKSAKNWKLRLLVRRWHSFLRMQKKVVQQLDHLVTVSKTSQQDIAKAFDVNFKKIHIIYNGIDTNIFQPGQHDQRIPFSIITTASADAPLKGLEYLIKAIALTKTSYPEIKLLVIGKPGKNSNTTKAIRELNLTETVTFISGISTEKLARHYKEAAIAVVPSLYEGFGFPAGEAMACGTPLISTDGGALPEIVGNAGVIVPSGDSKALSEAIIDLLGNPDKRFLLSKMGRKRIEEKFNWERSVSNLVSYYTRIIEKQVKPGVS